MDYKEKVIALLKSQELSKEQKEKLELIFPELAESEDERIRKKLIFDFQVLGKTEWGDLKVKDILAWLEKQGENKQILANSAKTCKKSQRMISAEAKEALYNKPAWKPSDEQMDALHYVFQHYTPNATDRLAWDSVITLELMYRDLKKLRGE